jgi:hypothetical protein
MIENIKIKERVGQKIGSNEGLVPVPLMETIVPYSKPGYRIVNETFKLEDLILRSFIYSLPQLEFPQFEITDSESEIQLQTLEFEWKSPRYHVHILEKSNIPGLEWLRIETLSILNSSPMPYREFNLQDRELGHDGMIAFQVHNVGWGVLQGSDNIVVVGNLERNIYLEKYSEGIKTDVALSRNTIQQVISENQNRTGFTLFNDSANNIFIDIIDTVSLSSFLTKIPPQSYYESPTNIAKNNIWATADGTSSLLVREFF